MLILLVSNASKRLSIEPYKLFFELKLNPHHALLVTCA